MRVTDFLSGRNVERQAVTRYMNRHEEIFNGHTKKVGKEIELDDVAVEELEKVYPSPHPVNLVNGVPQEEYIRVQSELIECQQKMNDLQNRFIEVQDKLAVAKASEYMLEDRNKRIEALEARQEDKEQEIKALQEELAKERSKTWVQKLFRK